MKEQDLGIPPPTTNQNMTWTIMTRETESQKTEEGNRKTNLTGNPISTKLALAPSIKTEGNTIQTKMSKYLRYRLT